MRRSPVVDVIHKIKIPFAAAGIFSVLVLAPALSFAQEGDGVSEYFSEQQPQPSSSATVTQPPIVSTTPGAPQTLPPMMNQNAFMQGMQNMMQGGQPNPELEEQRRREAEQKRAEEQAAYLGDVTDPDSPAYKANQLAEEAKRSRSESSALKKYGASEETGIEDISPPPEIESLQNINESNPGAKRTMADDPISKDMALDMRRDAQKEAALSYGARGGLAKRNFHIMERMRGFDKVLDKVFNFRALLVKTSSGLLIEPPIVKESAEAIVITAGGDEAAVADKIFDINKKAKIVSAPRDWRQYLIQVWSEVPPPPYVLWPKNKQEQAEWSTWVSQGWDAGYEQAEQIFESNVNQLVADYNGMVRYRMLLAQGMISAPYAMHEDRGVTGDRYQMRVGDRALRITGPSQFLMTGTELWKPADR